jgi:DNA-binding CsgD family transcriptional regulator
MTGTRSRTPNSAAATEVDAAHLQYLIRAIVAATEANAAHPQREDGSVSEHVVVDTDLDGVRYLLIRMPAVDRMRTMLSPREFEIVRMVAQGYQNKIIARILNISTWTVCAHVRRVFAKFGVSSRAAMVARLLETDIGLQAPLGPSSTNASLPPRAKSVQHKAVAPRARTEALSPPKVSIDDDAAVDAASRAPDRRRSETGARRMLTARY